MNVWIVNPYGTLPSEGWREYRSAMLARALAERGHAVRWWISDIEHRSKRRRPAGVADPGLPAEVTVEVVRARVYRRNISLGRVLYERSFAAGFARVSRGLPPPDLVVLADPSLFFAGAVTKFARARGVPLVLDVLDLWPEQFDVMLPQGLRGVGRWLFVPLYRRRDRLVRRASAVVAATKDYLEAVTERAGARLPMTVYLGVDTSALPPPGPVRSADQPLEVVYAGTLGDAYDMAVVLAAIERIAREGHPIGFTVAGDGPWKDRFSDLAARHPGQLRFLGSVSATELASHYVAAHVGLASYAPGSMVSMPVKFYDYMAAGLATVGSMRGEAAGLLESGVGLRYQAGDVEDLVAKLLHYQADAAALQAAREKAYRTSRQFDQKVQHARFAALIDQVLQESAPRCCG